MCVIALVAYCISVLGFMYLRVCVRTVYIYRYHHMLYMYQYVLRGARSLSSRSCGHTVLVLCNLGCYSSSIIMVFFSTSHHRMTDTILVFILPISFIIDDDGLGCDGEKTNTKTERRGKKKPTTARIGHYSIDE
uniref:Uncharacterized protein n=1 Tax=Lotharella oceanica TaxID=641309 RepID=A0A7S2TI43_9EUKA